MIHTRSLISLALFVPALAFGGSAQQGQQGQQGTAQSQLLADALSESEVAGIITIANQGELEAATLASARATNAGVKDFAQHMVKDHTAAGKKAEAVTGQLGIGPVDSPKSLELQAMGARDMTILQAVQGAEFDRIYINQQVEAHESLLKEIDSELLPSLQSESFKAFLTELRPTVAAHLEMAKKLQAELANVLR